MPWRRPAALLLALLGLIPGLTYQGRLCMHQGLHLVAVADRVATPAPRPRRTFVVVFDGLGVDAAAGMASLAALGQRGQCRRTDVGPLSISRPVYATLSTGLEADRHGCRGNRDPRPLRAESVWQVAREAGLRVAAVSELPWFSELFPGAFTSYRQLPRRQDFLRTGAAADVTLIHPLYVDEAGHEAGAASPQYREAVRRADRELAGLLASLDLSRDLIIVTADHGHAPAGGHGGRQEGVAHVLTCFAGRGVLPRPRPGALRATSVAPALALLLGLRFPAHMRAVDDDLDVLFQIADPAVYPAGYLDDRRQAVARYRAANQAWLARAAGSAADPGWESFYRHQRTQRLAPTAAVVAAALLALVLLGGPRGLWARLFGLGFALLFCAAVCLVQLWLRGSMDMSAVRDRGPFLLFTLSLVGLAGLLAGLAHVALRRSAAALRADCAGLLGGLGALCLGHPLVFGWRLAAPIPGPVMYFLPYFSCLLLGAILALALLLEGGLLGRRVLRRGAPAPR